MPAWKAWSISWNDSASVFCSPKLMLPKQSLDTVRLGARLKRGTPDIAFNYIVHANTFNTNIKLLKVEDPEATQTIELPYLCMYECEGRKHGEKNVMDNVCVRERQSKLWFLTRNKKGQQKINI